MPIPLCTHKGKEEMTYPTVHTFNSHHPTVAILRMRRAAYPTVSTKGRGNEGMTYYPTVYTFKSPHPCDHFTKGKSCLSHC